MKKFAYLWPLLFLCPFANAQSLQVVSHYPQTAYVVERLLSFNLTGGNNMVVTSVEVTGEGRCQGFADPCHSEVFQVYCQDPGEYDVRIRAENDNDDEILLIRDMKVNIYGTPESDFDSVNRTEPTEAGGEQ